MTFWKTIKTVAAGRSTMLEVQRTQRDYRCGAAAKSSAGVILDESLTAEGRRYVLSFVAAHTGTADIGHYFRFRRRGTFPTIWTQYNDSVVTQHDMSPASTRQQTRSVVYVLHETHVAEGAARRRATTSRAPRCSPASRTRRTPPRKIAAPGATMQHISHPRTPRCVFRALMRRPRQNSRGQKLHRHNILGGRGREQKRLRRCRRGGSRASNHGPPLAEFAPGVPATPRSDTQRAGHEAATKTPAHMPYHGTIGRGEEGR